MSATGEPTDPYQRLRSTLGMLASDLQQVRDDLEDSNCLDLAERLDRHTNEISDALVDVGRAMGNGSDQAIELSHLVDASLRRVIDTAVYPVVLRTDLGRDFRVNAPLEVLAAVLERALALSIRYAGPGGELSVSTEGDDSRARLCVEVRPSSPLPDTFSDRFRSLGHMVEDLGGAMSLDADDGLQIRLWFAAETSRES